MRIKHFVFTAVNYALQQYPIRILNSFESIEYIRIHHSSLVRFGEGEIELMDKKRDLKFQQYNEKLAQRMKEVIRSHENGISVAVPFALKKRRHLNERANEFWSLHVSYAMISWAKYFWPGRIYLDSLMTRCYIDLKDRSETSELYNSWRLIWEKRRLLVVEGEYSRLGVGNDLFSNAASIERILCPAENAFDCYDEILQAASSCIKETLVLIALGPTASVLAYDLAKRGYQALDVGHIDIEYEWFQMRAEYPVKVDGKYTNEVKNGKNVSDMNDTEYENQIIQIIR